MLEKLSKHSKIIGLVSAGIAACVAFLGEINNQKKEQRIDDIDNRLAMLEEKSQNTKESE